MKNNNVLDFETSMEAQVSETYFKINNIIGIALNIVIPVLLLFVFKVSFTNFLLAFLISDVALMGLNYLSLYLYKSCSKFIWLFRKKKYQENLDTMSLKDIKSLKKNLDQNNAFYAQKIKLINEKINEYKSFNSVSSPEIHKDDILYVEKIIEKFKEYDNVKWIKKSLNKIVEKSENLLEMIKEDPDSISVIISTYNIYAEELMKIIAQFEDMDDEQKEKYKPKIEKLIDTFYSHLNELEEKIQSFKEHSIDRDIDFLMKRLESTEGDDINV